MLEAVRHSGFSSRLPVLICCGPNEQADRLEEDFLEDVKLQIDEIPIEEKSDYENLRSWYMARTGKEPPVGL